METRIGIQGELGSSNHEAAQAFIKKHHFENPQIVPLRSTLRVLETLHAKEIDYGTFAWESSRAGLVEETQEAIKKYTYNKVDELKLPIKHLLLNRKSTPIDLQSRVSVYSHPQALKEHRDFLESFFSDIELIEEADTGYAAMQLSNGNYPPNSLVIAIKTCAEIYQLETFKESLPSNEGYWTRILLVSAS